MKILFFMPGFLGTTEAYRLDQLTALLERGENVAVLAMKKPKEFATEDLSEYHIKKRTTFLDVNSRRFTKVTKLLKWFCIAIIKNPNSTIQGLIHVKTQNLNMIYAIMICFIIAGQYNVIHAHFGHAGLFLYPVRDILDIPIVVSFYGWDYSYDLPARSAEYQKMFESVDKITAMNQFMKKRLFEAGCSEEKIEIVRIWAKDIFLKKEATKSQTIFNNQQINILSVGRLTEKKGYEYCLKAIQLLVKKKPNIHYHVIGDGPLSGPLNQLCQELNIEEYVTFWGAVSRDDVKYYIQESDIFLIHSVVAANGDMEGTPTVILEAGLLEKPVVSTFHAGIPEIIDHNKSGYIVNEKDITKTAYYLEELLNHKRKRKLFGKNLQHTIMNKYSKSENCTKLITMYYNIMI